MLSSLKNIARKSAFAKALYWKTMFLVKAVRQDFFSPRRLMLFLKVRPFTMVTYERIKNTYDLAKDIEKRNLAGAFVECGVWKGGAAAVMASVANPARQIWLFDSFEGLPEPTQADGERAKAYAGNRVSGMLSSIGKCVGPLEDVRKLFFQKLRLPGNNIHIEQGWFQDTLPKAKEKIGPIALLRMDADWYESTKIILECLFDNIVPGGYIIIDDYYCWEGCRRAVDEFFESRNLSPSIVRVDQDSVYIAKQE